MHIALSQFLGQNTGSDIENSGIETRRRSGNISGVTVQQLTEELKSVSKDGAPSENPKKLLDYLRSGSYSHVQNNRGIKKQLDTLIAGHASAGREDKLKELIETTGYKSYIRNVQKNKSGTFSSVVSILRDFLSGDAEGKLGAVAKLVKLMMGKDGVYDPQHPSLSEVMKNQDTSHLFSAASSLGLFTNIDKLNQSILNGDNVSTHGLQGEYVKAQIGFEMADITSLSKETGSVNDGTNTILDTIRLSADEAEQINKDLPKTVVRSGQNLNFYDWISQIREHSLTGDDKALSETVNNFIDVYTSVMSIRASKASSDETREKLKERMDKFEQFITTSAYGLPRPVLALIQRGLAYGEGYSAKTFSALTAGLEQNVPEQAVNDLSSKLTTAQEKSPRIFDAQGALAAVMGNGGINLYKLEGNRYIPTSTTLSHKPGQDVTTFLEAAQAYGHISKSYTTNVVDILSKQLMGANSIDPVAIKTFKANTVNSFGNNPNVWKIQANTQINDDNLKSKTNEFSNLISQLNETSGVVREVPSEEANTTVSEMVIGIIKATNSRLDISIGDLDTVIDRLNNEKQDDQKFNLSNLIQAFSQKDGTSFQQELDKLNNLLVIQKISKSNKTFTIREADSSAQSLAKRALYNYQSRDFYISLLNKFIHSETAESPLKEVSGERISALFEAEELQEALMADGRVAETVTSFDTLKNSPHKSGSAEAMILFGPGLPGLSESQAKNLKLTTLMGVLARIEQGRLPNDQKTRIYNDVVKSLFADQIKRSAEKSSNSYTSIEETKKRKIDELTEKLRGLLQNTEVSFTTSIGNAGSTSRTFTGDQLFTPEEISDGFYRNGRDSAIELATKAATKVRQKLIAAGVPALNIPREHDLIDILFDRDVADDEPFYMVKSNLSLPYDIPGNQVKTIGEAADLAVATSWRRYFLGQMSRSVAESAAQAPAEKFAHKLNNFYNDTSTSLAVFNHVRDCLSNALSNLENAESGRKAFADLKTAVEAGENRDRAAQFFSALTGTAGKHILDNAQTTSFDDLETRLEQWLALMEQICNYTRPNQGYEVKLGEKPRFKSNKATVVAQEKPTAASQRPSPERSEPLTTQSS